MRFSALLLLVMSCESVAQLLAVMPDPIAIPNRFADGTVASAETVNANFDEVAIHVAHLESLILTHPKKSPCGSGWGTPDGCDLVGDNLAIGDGMRSLVSNYISGEGGGNTAVGRGALFSLVSGGSNTAVGNFALAHIEINGGNSAFGDSAMFGMNGGFANTALGMNSMRTAGGLGDFNTAVGANSSIQNIDFDNWPEVPPELATQNTIVGARSFTYGSNNLVLGYGSLATGHKNTVVGANAKAICELCGVSNSIALGANATVDISNTIQLGDANIESLNTTGKLTTGDVTYPNAHGADGQVLGTNGTGELVWVGTDDIIAQHTQELEEQVASLQDQLQSQQEELLALVQSQQEQIAQLQRMVEHQFAMN